MVWVVPAAVAGGDREGDVSSAGAVTPQPSLCAQHPALPPNRPAEGAPGVGAGLRDHMTPRQGQPAAPSQQGPWLSAEPLFRPRPWPCLRVSLARGRPVQQAWVEARAARCYVGSGGVQAQCPLAAGPAQPPNGQDRVAPAGPDVAEVPGEARPLWEAASGTWRCGGGPALAGWGRQG